MNGNLGAGQTFHLTVNILGHNAPAPEKGLSVCL